jgi:hypothetical protein
MHDTQDSFMETQAASRLLALRTVKSISKAHVAPSEALVMHSDDL